MNWFARGLVVFLLGALAVLLVKLDRADDAAGDSERACHIGNIDHPECVSARRAWSAPWRPEKEVSR